MVRHASHRVVAGEARENFWVTLSLGLPREMWRGIEREADEKETSIGLVIAQLCIEAQRRRKEEA